MTDAQILEAYDDLMRKAEEQCPGGLQMVRDIEQIQRTIDLANAIEERTVTSRALRLQPEAPPHEWVPRELEAMGWPAELVEVARSVLLPDPPPPVIITTASLELLGPPVASNRIACT